MMIFAAMTAECYPVAAQTIRVTNYATFPAGTTTWDIYDELVKKLQSSMPLGMYPIVTMFVIHPNVVVPAEIEETP